MAVGGIDNLLLPASLHLANAFQPLVQARLHVGVNVHVAEFLHLVHQGDDLNANDMKRASESSAATFESYNYFSPSNFECDRKKTSPLLHSYSSMIKSRRVSSSYTQNTNPSNIHLCTINSALQRTSGKKGHPQKFDSKLKISTDEVLPIQGDVISAFAYYSTLICV